jgi:hypothetical protein
MFTPGHLEIMAWYCGKAIASEILQSNLLKQVVLVGAELS